MSSPEFSRLKPLCRNIWSDCSIENIEKLENVVKELDSDYIESLLDYITLPFIVHLNSKSNEKITIKCIDFLTLIFKQSKVKVFRFFEKIFNVMMLKISNVEDINKLNNTSEELKLSVCENMLYLVQSSTEEVLNEMYSLTFRLHLAHAFFVFNILLREEKSKTLLKAVLRTIGGFAYNEDYVVKKYKITEIIAGESLAFCLPGVSIALQKIICGDHKQAHSIILMALSILTDLIILTVGDESYERGIANDASSEIYNICYKSNEQTQSREEIPVVLKNETWFKSVSENLEIIIKNITIAATHDHWKVRLEFLKCSRLLLFSCTKTLENCIPVILPTVFGLSVDPNDIISSYSKDILVSLKEKLQTGNYANFNSVVEDNIENLISQLIKSKFTANNNKKLSTLKSLLGYIEISSSLNRLVFSMSKLERIIMTLVALLEFSILELNLVEEMPLLQNIEITTFEWPKKRFKYFENEDIFDTICKICYCLGHIGNSLLLIDYLLQKVSSNNFNTLQCIFVIGSIIKGLSKEPNASQKYSTLISNVLEVFLSSSLFDVPINNTDIFHIKEQVNDPSTALSLSNNVLNKNKLQICLLLEAIANCSVCSGTDFKLHLMNILCPVMEKAGSSNFVISQCGQICLYHITHSCKYNSVQELIKDNADYISNVMLINFRHYLHKPEIAVVLRIAMEQSDAEALVLFRDLIFEILEFLDYNQSKAYPLLSVLFSVVVCIKKWFPCKENHLVNNTTSKNTINKSLRTLVAEYISLKETGIENYTEELETVDPESTNNKDFTENICDTEDDNSVEEKKPDIPLHINIICEIFKRCVHLQSSENKYLRMLTLETVEVCIVVLRDYENQLHPLVHEFWNPFLRRFTEDTFVPKAFNVLLSIANECGDFIRSRTIKEVLPKLVLFLQKEHANSLKGNFKQYQYTIDHSFQILVLSEIGNLCTKLDIDSKNINAVATVCLPYVEKKQPKILQDAAVKSLRALATVDPDAIWFYWNVAFSEEKVLIPPHDKLLTLNFPYSNNSLTSVSINSIFSDVPCT